MQSVVSSCFNQLTVDMGSVCGRYYKPVVVVCCCTSAQQCSVGLDEQAGPDELVINNTSSVYFHQITSSTMEKTASGQLQDEGSYSFCSSSNISKGPSDDGSYEDESYKCGQGGDCLVVDEMVQMTPKNNGFAVNCVAVQETYRHE